MKKSAKIITAIVLALLIGIGGIGLNTVHDAHASTAPERFSQDGLWGLRDSDGNIIVPAMYDWIYSFHEGIAVVVIWDMDAGWWGREYFGFIDITGRVIVPPIFEGAGDFSDGRAAVRSGGLWGFIDRNGALVVPHMYQNAGDFVEGLAAVRYEDRWGFIDRNGAMVVPAVHDDVGDFSEGFAVIRSGDLFGFINRSGNIVVPAQFEMVSNFSGGVAGVGRGSNRWDGEWGLINTSGELIVPMQHSWNDIMLALDIFALPAALIPANVEQSHWSEIRQILPLRTSIRILDIGTGIYYYVLSMSNGNHADVEPVTAADTALLMETFGGHATWSGRPVWVTIGNRTFSASIHSMAHAQATVANNNMDGHICLHFYGSTTHNTNLPTYEHVILQAQRAFNAYNQVAAGLAGVQTTPTPTPAPAPATPAPGAVSASPTAATVLIDGVQVNFQAYHIGGHNFFRLRDLAYALNGTAAQFNLGWDAANQAISIYNGEAYVPVGGEMSIGDAATRTATPTRADIFLDGVMISPRAYHIAGSNFFMLAELAEALGFTVAWDPAARAILIWTE